MNPAVNRGETAAAVAGACWEPQHRREARIGGVVPAARGRGCAEEVCEREGGGEVT